jgi:hypothetical protein
MIAPRRNLRRGVLYSSSIRRRQFTCKPACRSGQRISSPSAQELAARSLAGAARRAPPEEAAPAVLPAGEELRGPRAAGMRFASLQAAADLPPAERAAAWLAG